MCFIKMISKVIVFLSLASLTFAAQCGPDYYGQSCTNGKYNTDGNVYCATTTCTEGDCCTDAIAPKACTSWTLTKLYPTNSNSYTYKSVSSTAATADDAGCKAACSAEPWCQMSVRMGGWGPTYCYLYSRQNSDPGVSTASSPNSYYECNQRGYQWWLQRATCDSNAGCDSTTQYVDTTKKCADTSCTSADQTTCCFTKAQCSSQTCATNYYVADPAKYCAVQYCTNSDNCCEEAAQCSSVTCSTGTYNADTAAYCADPAACTEAECCVDQDQCDGTTCNANRYVADTSKYCATDTCTEGECCTAQDQCSSVNCSGNTYNADAAAYCATDTCTEAECCTAQDQCDGTTCDAGRSVADTTKYCSTDTCTEAECCVDDTVTTTVAPTTAAPTTDAPTTDAPTTDTPTTTSAPKEKDHTTEVIVGIGYLSLVALVFSYAVQGEAINTAFRSVRIF